MNTSKTWCLEYSPIQNAYHISERWEYERNVAICKLRGIENGYRLLSENDSYEEAEAAKLKDMEQRGVKL